MNAILQENIITKLGLDNLPIEKQADLLEQMERIIHKQIALRIVDLLSKEDLDNYQKISDEDEDRGLEFLSKKIPNYGSIIEEEIIDFKQKIVS